MAKKKDEEVQETVILDSPCMLQEVIDEEPLTEKPVLTKSYGAKRNVVSLFNNPPTVEITPCVYKARLDKPIRN